MTDSCQTSSSPSAEPTSVSARSVLLKSVLLLLIAVLGGILCNIPPCNTWLEPAGRLSEWFRHLGALGIIVYLASSTALILLGLPRLAFCAIAGALYGIWGGLALSIAASMLSYYIAFLWIRGRRDSGTNAMPLPKQLSFLSADPGFSGVVLGRLLPFPGMLITLALSLSNVSHRSYLVGSAIGCIPQTVPAVLFGVLGKDVQKWGRLVVIALICILTAWIVIHRATTRSKRARINPQAVLGSNET